MNQDHKSNMYEHLSNIDAVVVAVVADDGKIVMRRMVRIEQQQHIVRQQMYTIELLGYYRCLGGNKHRKMK